jgi:type II secretory pathway pseudopilin PulG
MKMRSARRGCGGFTMVEIMIAMGVLTTVGVACYSMLLSSSILFAKNVSLNTSNTILRTALDRMYNDVSHAYGVPKLINADGSAAANPSAVGISFDLYLGGPYVVTNPGTTGFSASTQSFSMKNYAADPLTAQPVPVANDVVVLDNGPTRPVVASCTSTSASNVQTLTANLQSSLGNAVSWNATTTKTAFLVHKKAYIVATVNGHGELRLYNNAETVADYNDPANYVVLSQELSGQAGENTPFSLVTPLAPQNDNKFLNIAMRVEDQRYNQTLAVKQAKDFTTFLQLDTMLRPRN